MPGPVLASQLVVSGVLPGEARGHLSCHVQQRSGAEGSLGAAEGPTLVGKPPGPGDTLVGKSPHAPPST